MRLRTALAVVVLSGAPLLAQAPQVTKETVPGITNFARVQTTVACAGATKAEALPEIKKMGFTTIVNLREASEPGADIDAEASATKALGLNFVHIPFNVASPAPDVVERFLAAMNRPGSQPAFIHCAGGGRAATLWMIKRVKMDGWDRQRAIDEATALGMANERLKQFAINYLDTHKG